MYRGDSTLSDRLCIRSNGAIKKPVLSTQQLVSCANNGGCAGGQLQKYWQFANTNGIVSEACYPYSTATKNSGSVPACTSTCANGQPFSATTNYKVAASQYNYNGYMIAPYKPTDWRTNVPLIQKEIMTNGPVQAAFTCTREIYNYKSGVYKCMNCTDTVGGHAIKIVGWGTSADGSQYWIIQNSWGKYFILIFNKSRNFMGNERVH
jgi:cathepsin B